MLGYHGHSRYLPFLDPYSWTYPTHFTRLPGVVSLGTEILVVVSKIPMDHGLFTNGLPFKKLLPEGWELPSPTNGRILENILRCFCLVKGSIFCTWFWMIVTVGFSIDQMVNWKLRDFQRTTDYCLKFQTSRHLNIFIFFLWLLTTKKSSSMFTRTRHSGQNGIPNLSQEKSRGFWNKNIGFEETSLHAPIRSGFLKGFLGVRPGGTPIGSINSMNFNGTPVVRFPARLEEAGTQVVQAAMDPDLQVTAASVSWWQGVVPAESWLKGGVKSLVLSGFIFSYFLCASFCLVPLIFLKKCERLPSWFGDLFLAC